MTADRVGSDQFRFTHDFLAQMLGVRPASVTDVAGRLARSGALAYRRGLVTVLDRDQLEQASCECYAVIRQATQQLLAVDGSRPTSGTRASRRAVGATAAVTQRPRQRSRQEQTHRAASDGQRSGGPHMRPARASLQRAVLLASWSGNMTPPPPPAGQAAKRKEGS